MNTARKMELSPEFEGHEKKKLLANLNHRIRECERCRLATTRKHALAGEGNVDACIMLIALSPGEKEDSANRMFVGPSGQVLDRLLHAAGMDREMFYMTNLVKCMLPKNRRPKMDEIESCCCFLNEEIGIIHAETIVPLGYYATRYILTRYHADPPAARADFTKCYGKLFFSDDQKIFPLPHPSSLLYQPAFEPETVKKYRKLQILP